MTFYSLLSLPLFYFFFTGKIWGKVSKLQGFLLEHKEVRIWPKSRADIAANTHPRTENMFNPWMVDPTDTVLSEHYNAKCSCCYLGHSHDWEQHHKSLLAYALQQQFGGCWQWEGKKVYEMCTFETSWWALHTPFPWQQRYRQTPHW